MSWLEKREVVRWAEWPCWVESGRRNAAEWLVEELLSLDEYLEQLHELTGESTTWHDAP